MSPNASMSLSKKKSMNGYHNLDPEKQDIEYKEKLRFLVFMLQVLLFISIASSLVILFYALVSVFVASPSLELKSMQVYDFSILDDEASAKAKVELKFTSQNEDFDIFVDSIQSDMFYKLQIISTTPLEPFVLQRKAASMEDAHFRLMLQNEMMGVIESLRQDMRDGAVSFFMGLKIMGYFKTSFGWKIHFRMLGGCADVTIGFKGEHGAMVGETNCSILNSIFSPLTFY